MNMNISLCILVAVFLTMFALTLIKEEILVSIYNILKTVPKFAKIILFITTVVLLGYLIVFEAMKMLK